MTDRLREILSWYRSEKAETSLTTADGEEIRYTVCNRTEGRLIAGIGGLFVGLISIGLGELNGYFLLQRCRVPSKVSVATSVFVVALTALSASAGHFVRFAQSGGEVLTTALSIVIFTTTCVGHGPGWRSNREHSGHLGGPSLSRGHYRGWRQQQLQGHNAPLSHGGSQGLAPYRRRHQRRRVGFG